MIEQSYNYGFSDELEKIAGAGEVVKFLGSHPTSMAGLAGAAAGAIPGAPLVVTPFGLLTNVNENVEKYNRYHPEGYLKELPKRMLAGAITGATLAAIGQKAAKEFIPKVPVALP